MSNKNYFLYGIRNGFTFEQICPDYQTWLSKSENLLKQGFSVHISSNIWAKEDLKQEVILFKDTIEVNPPW